MGFLQIHNGDFVTGVREEDVLHILGLQLHAANIQTGMATEVLRLINLTIHQAMDAVLGVIGKTQNTGRTGRAAEQFFHHFAGSKG